MNVELNDFLELVVKNNSYCQSCELNHSGICFFAYGCISQDFLHYLNNKKE